VTSYDVQFESAIRALGAANVAQRIGDACFRIAGVDGADREIWRRLSALFDFVALEAHKIAFPVAEIAGGA
jgi:hypothetical protein